MALLAFEVIELLGFIVSSLHYVGLERTLIHTLLHCGIDFTPEFFLTHFIEVDISITISLRGWDYTANSRSERALFHFHTLFFLSFEFRSLQRHQSL